MSESPRGEAANPYLVAVLVLLPAGGVVTALAYLLASELAAFVLGAGFLGALVSMLGYGLRERLAGEPT